MFLVERYLPHAAAETLPASVARVAELCARSAGTDGTPRPASQVQYLHSTYLPTEDTCFCLFRAVDAEAVRALNDEAGFALDRITAAILMRTNGPAPTSEHSGSASP